MTRAWTAITLSVLLICSSAARAADQSAEAVLKAKGLTKVGLLYLLDTDVNLRAGLRVMRKAGSQLDSSLAKRGEIERQLRGAREAELQLYSNNQDLHARMQKVKDIPFRYNDLVAQANQVEAQIHQAELYIADREKALKAFSIPSEQYTTAVNDLFERMEITEKHYEALAADPDVVATLARINAEAHFPVKLGPSAQFATELASVRREHEKVRAAAIKFDLEGGVPVVHVTLNGTLPWKMVLDSGAAEVTLTFEVAQELGLTPEASDPTMRMRSADGKVTVARLKTLKSVKLGQFTVENVECVVLPEGVPGSNLLGATFLSRFVYQMDLNAGEVHLSQIGPTFNETVDKTPSTAPAPESGINNAINLIPLIDPEKDAVAGTWQIDNGRLIGSGNENNRLRIPYEPPDEYDFHVRFTRVSENHDVCQMLWRGGRSFLWTMGAHDNQSCFFANINGIYMDGNPSKIDVDSVLTNGQAYDSVVKVRKDSVEAFMNGKLVDRYSTDFFNLSIKNEWSLGSVGLGLGTFRQSASFDVIELVEVSGHGKRLSHDRQATQ
jgi:aspartyl protease family protein